MSEELKFCRNCKFSILTERRLDVFCDLTSDMYKEPPPFKCMLSHNIKSFNSPACKHWIDKNCSESDEKENISNTITTADCCYTCVFGLDVYNEGRSCIANGNTKVNLHDVCSKYQRSSKFKKERE